MSFVGSEDITIVTRTLTFVNGKPTESDDTTTDVEATVSPVPGDEVEKADRGEELQPQYRIILEEEVSPPDHQTQNPGDHVLIRGERFEVLNVKYFPTIIPHYEARVRRVDSE